MHAAEKMNKWMIAQKARLDADTSNKKMLIAGQKHTPSKP